jgi:hypothetical protein
LSGNGRRRGSTRLASGERRVDARPGVGEVISPRTPSVRTRTGRLSLRQRRNRAFDVSRVEPRKDRLVLTSGSWRSGTWRPLHDEASATRRTRTSSATSVAKATQMCKGVLTEAIGDGRSDRRLVWFLFGCPCETHGRQ